MTNRTLTALIIRIAGIYLFTKIFDHFGSYFLSVLHSASVSIYDESIIEPIDKFYFAGTLLIIANIATSLFLFTRAEWISKKIVKTETKIKTELNPESLTKVILLTVGVIWLIKLIYLIPSLIDYCVKFISIMNGNEKAELPDFELPYYVIKMVLTLIIIFRIEKISNWIIKKI